jgi:GDP-4-dehydro-6-deoxy-D-mannose reductase
MVRLITGAGGMMGSHLYDALRDQDVLPTFYNSTLDKRETITQEMEMLDVLHYERVKQVLSEVKPSVIYHLAAQSRPDVSFTDPARTVQINVMGTLHLLQACYQLGLKPLFINASSSAVYGDIDWSIPPDENSHCHPLSPYGTSKLAQEHIVKNFNQMHDIPYVNVRIFNCTGPRKINDFVSDVCRRVVNKEFPLKVGNLDGLRSIVDVRDLVRGLVLCENIKNETINLGSDVSHKIGDVLKLIAGDTPYEIDDSLLRPTDEPIILGNINKAKDLLGWKQEITLEQTITNTLDYWRTL